MSNVLKALAKIARGSKMVHLVAPFAARLDGAPDAVAATVLGLSAPVSIEGTPPFAASTAPGDFDPRGGIRAPFSLPLSATPFTIFETEGSKK